MSQASGLPGASVNLRLVEFVQAQPPERTASEIVELAKEAGLELELLQVYRFRELLRAKQARSAPTPPKDSPMTPDESPAPTATEAPAAPEDAKPTAASPPQAKAGRGRPGRRPGGEDTRAGWVRSLPLDTPVKEVVERAKEKGWELSEGYVYAIRSKMKAPKKTTAKTTAPKKAPAKASAPVAKGPKKAKSKPGKAAEPKAQGKPKRGRPNKKQEAAGGGALFRKPSEADVRKVEEEFAKLALEIGLLRSGQMLQELKGRLAELVRPRGRG